MESYFEAKRRLFTHEYTDTAVINIDTEYGSRLFERCEVTPISISRLNKDAIWHFKEFHNTTSGMDFALRGSGGILIESSTQLHGAFNLDNLMAAIAIAVELGVDPLEIALIAPKLKGAPGRMEGVNLGQSFKALVDYAHSPDAVVNVLLAAREFTEGKLIAVLGCGGDRDASKRPLMGQALVEGSDFAIMTSDNPRSEDPEVILQQMSASTSGKIILDRREAIAAAVKLATAGDTVMILGKGHETGQEIAGITHDFDDRLELARAIEAKK
jgi:UDP-N-acetylmuramoyl-L-alanyl-D-glutamate--2,6-diaminopimelate ligase